MLLLCSVTEVNHSGNGTQGGKRQAQMELLDPYYKILKHRLSFEDSQKEKPLYNYPL